MFNFDPQDCQMHLWSVYICAPLLMEVQWCTQIRNGIRLDFNHAQRPHQFPPQYLNPIVSHFVWWCLQVERSPGQNYPVQEGWNHQVKIPNPQPYRSQRVLSAISCLVHRLNACLCLGLLLSALYNRKFSWGRIFLFAFFLLVHNKLLKMWHSLWSNTATLAWSR